MHRVFSLLIIAGVLTATAFSQSLGDAARQNRQTKRKPAARVITNDDLSSRPTEPPTASGQAAKDPAAKETKDPAAKEAPKATETTAAGDSEKAEKTESTEKKDGDADEAAKKAAEQFKAKVADQKAKVDLLQRELDVLQKENEIQIARRSQDLGQQLRDPKAWSEDSKKNQDAIDAKKQALQQAKDDLDAIREEGRKANAPSSSLE